MEIIRKKYANKKIYMGKTSFGIDEASPTESILKEVIYDRSLRTSFFSSIYNSQGSHT